MSLEQLWEKTQLRRASDYTNPRNQAEILPYRYGLYSSNIENKFNGYPLICIDTVNFKYIPMDGEGMTDANVKVWDKDGTLIAGANYTYDSNEADENGATVATLTFTGDRIASEPMTAEVEGQLSSASYWYEQQSQYPLVAFYDFIVNKCGFANTVFNATSWWEALTRCRDYDYFCRILIDQDTSPAELLSNVCASFNMDWWIDGNSKIKFIVHPAARSYRIGFPTSDVQFKENTFKQRSKLSDVVNQLSVNYGSCSAGFVYTDDGSSTLDTPSTQLFGQRLEELDLTYLGGDTNWSTQIGNVQSSYLLRYANPQIIEFTTKDRRFVALERFDIFALSIDFMYDKDLSQLRNAAYQILYRQTSLTGHDSKVVALKIPNLYKYLYWFSGGNPSPGTTQGRVLADGSRKAGGDPDPNKY